MICVVYADVTGREPYDLHNLAKFSRAGSVYLQTLHSISERQVQILP